MWKCNKCKGVNVTQEWSVFRPMNDPDADIWDDWWQTMDSYWCDDCDEECSPEREEKQIASRFKKLQISRDEPP